MPEQVNQIVTAIMPYVVTIVTAIFGYLAVVIKKKLTEKLDTDTKREIAESTVKYVQQLYESLDGKEKFKKALDTMIEWLNEKGIKITEAEATILIEASVKGFKDSWNTLPICTSGFLQVGDATTTTTNNETITINMDEQKEQSISE